MPFYIIPFETDINLKKGMKACPKYLNLIGVGKGVCANEVLPNQWKVNFYIVKCAENLLLEAMTDVITLDKGTLAALRTKLINLGIDLTGITTKAAVERKIIEWLGHPPKLLSEI